MSTNIIASHQSLLILALQPKLILFSLKRYHKYSYKFQCIFCSFLNMTCRLLLNMPWCLCPFCLPLPGTLPSLPLRGTPQSVFKHQLSHVVFPTLSTQLPAQTQIHLLNGLLSHSTLHLPSLALALPLYKYLFTNCQLKAENILFTYSSYRINCEASKYAIILF